MALSLFFDVGFANNG